MNSKQFARITAKSLATLIGLAAASYASFAVVTWLRYGKPAQSDGESADPLLDIFMPDYEVVDRHEIQIAAPPDVALSAASEIDLERYALIRGIFKGRELIFHSKPRNAVRPHGFLAEMKSLGWGLLAELPGREIVMGGATKPWEPSPIFRALPPDEFTNFHEPGYVKIIWTLRAGAAGDAESVFRTETRAVATDSETRKKFRRYWSFLSPGIIAIRKVMLPAVKSEAERRLCHMGHLLKNKQRSAS